MGKGERLRDGVCIEGKMKANNPRATRIRAISFDAADTLFRLRRGVGEVYAEVSAKEGFVLESAEVEMAFRTAWKACGPRADGPREADDVGFWRELVAKVMRTFGVEGEVAERIFPKIYEKYCGATEWELFPETLEVLGDLHKEWPLFITSNYDGRLHGTLAALGLAEFFQKVIISSEVGSDKPSGRIFAATQQAAGMAASEILHVGDQLEADWRGALRFGMAAWHLQRPQQSLAELRWRVESGNVDLPE